MRNSLLTVDRTVDSTLLRLSCEIIVPSQSEAGAAQDFRRRRVEYAQADMAPMSAFQTSCMQQASREVVPASPEEAMGEEEEEEMVDEEETGEEEDMQDMQEDNPFESSDEE